MSHIRNVYFDWSGVVKDFREDMHRIINLMFVEFGIPKISMKEFQDNWDQDYMKFYAKYLPDVSHDEQAKVYVRLLKEVSEQYPPRAFTGMAELIQDLHSEGKRLFVISADYKESLDHEISLFELDGHFTEVMFDIRNKTEKLAQHLAQHNLAPEHSLIVGDSLSEIEAGKHSGVTTVSTGWGLLRPEDLQAAGPDHLIHTAQELRDIIDNHQ